ncbi:AAA+ ATPase domain-containing protein [Cynara cardunculus var. scolymus]|uniref:AAA+ ATPase domain-containing protein n=1 Tax=Cynara cardunculus var. scolymus TaxID=59895 RepID=A0A124SBX8_CYNCS|nr:AAA+ ATPase domain-containing protein [Cynara cardunculus var. scolymus]
MEIEKSKSIGKRSRSHSWSFEEVFVTANHSRSNSHAEQDEEALKWAALEKLPTFDRLRTTIMESYFLDDSENQQTEGEEKARHKQVDLRSFGMKENQCFINKLFNVAEEDNGKFLKKIRDRYDKFINELPCDLKLIIVSFHVGCRAKVTLPSVEVRYEHLNIEADCFIGDRALPTLANTVRNIAESALTLFGIRLSESTQLTILHDASGIIKPSRMTLLLGPPSSGKTTLLQALAGKLDSSLKVEGKVTYNGHSLNEFVPQRTSAYVSQDDVHIAEMTVKETLDFSVRCQGIGSRYELLTELARREKAAGIFPEPEVDLFMKSTAMEGADNNLITDYILKILGLDVCRDTIVGNEMIRGISGGQKKRVTTGEMMVGPTKTLFMDDISTGLDSSTTFQIVKCLQQIAHLTNTTILMSLLQPSPETFDLFDDVILLSQGQIVYQGPKKHVLEFFETCGFRCPDRKGHADFLQEKSISVLNFQRSTAHGHECFAIYDFLQPHFFICFKYKELVTSRKDQEQYWEDKSKAYKYISVSQFAESFKKFHVGLWLQDKLSVAYDKSKSHKSALVFRKYLVPKMELLKASFQKECLLIKRNSVVHIAKLVQTTIVAIIGATVFLRTNMHTNNEEDGAMYVGALLFGLITNTFNAFAELPMIIERLPVIYKQRDLLFHPPWAFTIPTFLLGVPTSMVDSTVWTVVTYSIIGFAPEASRFFKHFLLTFLIQQMAGGLFRFIASVCRTMTIANTGGVLVVELAFLVGGFLLPKGQIPSWWGWAYWVSPFSYGFNAITVNEMSAPRWMNKLASDNVTELGVAVLRTFDITPDRNKFWIGAAALLGFALLFNFLLTLALTYLNPLRKAQAIISKEIVKEKEDFHNKPYGKPQLKQEMLPQSMTPLDVYSPEVRKLSTLPKANKQDIQEYSTLQVTNPIASKRGMVLPFTPLCMSFDSISYYIDMPPEMIEQGITKDKLQLLREITGAFRPGVLTALMGVSGAGKTTLMDVLAGRKTGGLIEGDIKISGFPKKQETFARVSGYCEQSDIHSPQVTVHESLVFSAFLRLPEEVSKEVKMLFVTQVMDLVELDNLKDSIVGVPGVSGLSTQQRKRLTIAVELVANPSIIFMDEPTSGLDARAAAIVMRTVRNTVDTGRTVVCTIHQPSIDIFEAFDELLLLKRGGQVIYFGPLGQNSEKMINYFEEIPGVSKLKAQYNPATWMLEVSSDSAESRLGIDFSEHYRSSPLYKTRKLTRELLSRRNTALVEELSTPPSGDKELHFNTMYSQSMWGQFKSCIQKQWWSYWRTPDYNLTRIPIQEHIETRLTSVFQSPLIYTLYHRDSSTDLTTIIGAMYVSVMFAGFNNCVTILPVASLERTVFYRERAAGMYSSLPYAMAQTILAISNTPMLMNSQHIIVELPFVLVQTMYYTLILYAMLSFEWTVAKFFWFFFISFFTFLYFTCYGLMIVSITPNHQAASIFAAAINVLFNLFSGFFIPRPRIPKWWMWYYWICPLQWTIQGLIISQYGDLDETIKVPGMSYDPTIKWYVQSYFGYNADALGSVATILVVFTVLFASIYAYCLHKLNFQIR